MHIFYTHTHIYIAGSNDKEQTEKLQWVTLGSH